MVLAVPNQGTFVPGVTDSAAFLNANVRDAVTFLLNPPLCRCKQTVTQSPANATFTAITFTANVVDSYSGHSTTVNTSRYVAQVAGWYTVAATVAWSANGTGIRTLQLRVNATAVDGTTDEYLAAVPGDVTVVSAGGDDVFLNTGDFVEVFGYQSSGGALATYSTGAIMSKLNVRWSHV